MFLLAALWSLQPIHLKVTPATAFAPVLVTIEAKLMPIDSDRRVTIVMESETFYTSTECQLEGADSPKRCPVMKPFQVWIREPGMYHISAGITAFSDEAHYRAVDRVTLDVLSN